MTRTATTRTRTAATATPEHRGLPTATPEAAPAAAATPTPATPRPTPATAPTGAPCGCGCGESANPGRAYRPGHDARHAGQVGRWIAEQPEGAPAAEIEAAYATLPTPALQTKARRFVENRKTEATRKAAAAAIRAQAKADLQAALRAI